MAERLGRGAYDADRAAALAGVPKTTLHYWARKGLYVPSIVPEPRTRLWSWLDLLSLRAIDWLRNVENAPELPRVSTREIAQALAELDALEIPRERLHAFLALSRSGHLFIRFDDDCLVRARPGHQEAIVDMIDLVSPYGTGPYLFAPRPTLRIIPGKLHGEPHIRDTRIPTLSLYALHRDGYDEGQLFEMYPSATAEGIRDAIDLETVLERAAA
jgi:uncharacterized protein (DUF433 family)/DNA-binding transcriptional MerR regulator